MRRVAGSDKDVISGSRNGSKEFVTDCLQVGAASVPSGKDEPIRKTAHRLRIGAELVEQVRFCQEGASVVDECLTQLLGQVHPSSRRRGHLLDEGLSCQTGIAHPRCIQRSPQSGPSLHVGGLSRALAIGEFERRFVGGDPGDEPAIVERRSDRDKRTQGIADDRDVLEAERADQGQEVGRVYVHVGAGTLAFAITSPIIPNHAEMKGQRRKYRVPGPAVGPRSMHEQKWCSVTGHFHTEPRPVAHQNRHGSCRREGGRATDVSRPPT